MPQEGKCVRTSTKRVFHHLLEFLRHNSSGCPNLRHFDEILYSASDHPRLQPITCVLTDECLNLQRLGSGGRKHGNKGSFLLQLVRTGTCA